MLRSSTRLVILDEPFRGLDRSQRRSLLNRARELWKDATLLCVTHDVGETQVFDRVVVVEAGRIIEEGLPSALAVREGSRYQQLLQTEESIRRGLWSSGGWRRLRLEEGLLAEAERSVGSRWTS
jgi:ATP-binding cassette subfamily B protein